MNLFIPPPPKRRSTVWPVIGFGLGHFVLGGAVALGTGMWTTLDERPASAELTAQMHGAGVTRAAGVDAVVLPLVADRTVQALVTPGEPVTRQPFIHHQLRALTDKITEPPGVSLPGGGLGVQSFVCHVVQARFGEVDAQFRETAESLGRQAITSPDPGTIATRDGHLHTLIESDTDTFALVFHGDLNSQSRIVAANPNLLTGGGAPVAGQRLRIPRA